MFTTNFINSISYFYPVGNTPAVCLTQNLPRGTPSRILLLGCGDVRNILFTSYSDDRSRVFDITCCDIEAAILARNVLLLTLLVDDKDGSKSGAIWSIYYHLYLAEKPYRLLQSQLEKLLALSVSFQSWQESNYGAFLKMCDGGSLAKIHKIWETYCTNHLSTEEVESYENRFLTSIQRARDIKEARIGKAHVYTGFRSTAPVSMCAFEDLSRLYKEYWSTGTAEGRGNQSGIDMRPNPMFTKDASTLHYGTDPLLGFHLATAYVPLLSNSPLHVQSGNNLGYKKVVDAAKAQFRAWSTAFRDRIPKSMTLRFFTGDALSFCYTLSSQQSPTQDSGAHLYRDAFHAEPLTLEESDYGVSGNAPTTFNTIDTSNLLDHLGALNLLVATSPLLSEDLAASLYTETLVKRESSLKAMSDGLLCGHFPSISILLGLFPLEYWTNATAVSTVDEAMFDIVHQSMKSPGQSDGQMYCRFAWKGAPTRQNSSARQKNLRLSWNESDLAQMLFSVYQKMFQHDNVNSLLSNFSLQRVKNDSFPRYHRGSFAAFLGLVKRRVSCNWATVMEKFLSLLEENSNSMLGHNYNQELYLYLHIFDLYSVPTMKVDFLLQGKTLETTAKNANLPSPVLCVTIKVPRSVLKPFTTIPHANLGTPPVHYGLGWSGESPLLVSFLAPSWIACLEPETTKVTFGLQSTPLSAKTFAASFGLHLIVYETSIGYNENVYITKYAPNQSGLPSPFPIQAPELKSLDPVDDSFRTLVIPIIDTKTSQITALTGRINLRTARAKEVFRAGAQVESIQTSACVITIIIGTELHCTLNFPAPVMQPRNKIRLARTSSYIEVVVPVANPEKQDYLHNFMYPTFLHGLSPVNWSLPHLNLDCLPMLDMAKTTELQWLITHTSLMFSTRERALRETSTTTNGGIHTDVRLNYKDSLFSIFMSFSSLQGDKSKIFGLSNRSRGGVAILIIGRQMRVDLANHTVTLDASVLPLTKTLIPRISLFLQLITKMGINVINVNDDEMRLWKQTIPACVERCRDWSHTSSCEYLTSSQIPISLEHGEKFLCSCGNGKRSASTMSGIPKWETVSKYATRMALSPTFSVPYVEGVCEMDESRLSTASCDACGKEKRDDGSALMKCGRCQKAKYCSNECQRARWESHKKTCKRVSS